MASVEKIEQKARKSPKSITFAEACALAEAHFGPARKGSGSHVAIYKMPWQGDPRINLQRAEGGKAKEYQVKQLIKAIDKKKGEHDS
ncbi:toxin HicA [Agromyces bauzanensis]